jgi:hypothetical protein
VVLDEAGGAGWVKENLEGEVGGGLGGGDGVEGEAGFGGEGLLGAGIARGNRRKDLEERFGEREGFGGEGLEDGGEGLLLGLGSDDLGGGLAVAAFIVAVVEAADLFDGGLGLVAMEEVERNEGVFELGERGTGLDRGRCPRGARVVGPSRRGERLRR